MTLKDLFGDSVVVNGQGEKLSVDDLKGKVVGLYFSAHWCPPCRGFTPKLVETYKKFKDAGKNWEIIFVSSDRDEASFKEYFGEMPWLALPFEDSERKTKLSSKFGVSGIPSLVILDENGNTLTKDGRSAVMGDPEGKNFPWREKTFDELMKDIKFVDKKGTEITFDDVQKYDYIGFYFSAHWCPPCRGFTPKLVETYKKLKDEGKKFEIFFISSDRDEASFNEYYGEMPWAVLPFQERNLKADLSKVFEVEGIPTFAIVEAKTLKVITTNGRGAVDADPEGKDYPWKRKPLSDVGMVVDQLNGIPCLVLLLDQMEAEEADKIIEKVEPVAKKFNDQFESSGKAESDYPLIFAYGKKGNGLVGRIRSVASIEEANNVVILNLPQRKKYQVKLDKIDDESITSLVEEFLDGKVNMSSLS